jgi:phosphoenolpyruvate carboxykinase (GTP)
VLEWIFERVAGGGDAVDTPIGRVPAPGAVDTTGLKVSDTDMTELLSVDAEEWRRELPLISEHYERFGDRVPPALRDELDALAKRLAG